MKNIAQTDKKVMPFEPKSYAVDAGYVNGVANASLPALNGIDTRDFEEVLVSLLVGVITATGTVTVTLHHSHTNTSADMVAVTDAAGTPMAFTVKAVAQDQKVYVGRLKGANLRRYLFVKAVVATDAGVFAVDVALSASQYEPVTQDNAIEFNH